MQHMPAPCVLVVDTSAATLAAIVAALRESGQQVLTARSAREALSVLAHAERAPELALLEFRLRDGRGDELAAQLRRRWPRLIVIYFSSVAPSEDEGLRRALLAPRTQFLGKPTSLDAIERMLRSRAEPDQDAEPDT